MSDQKAGTRVAVIMPTFHGEPYVGEQIVSILNQSHQSLVLYVRDDGSKDSTFRIVKSFAEKDDRVIIVDADTHRIGVTRSIKVLLEHVNENIVFFSDQDDVWAKNKISTMLDYVPDHGAGQLPVVVFSDLEVVDENLHPVTDSFWKVSGIDPHRFKFRDILRRNCVTGCASMINRAMLERMRAMPDQAVHDWWVACVAAKQGLLIPLSDRFVKYRQHGANSIGVQERGLKKLRHLLSDVSYCDKVSRQIMSSIDHLLALRTDCNQSFTIVDLLAIQTEVLRRYIFFVLAKVLCIWPWRGPY